MNKLLLTVLLSVSVSGVNAADLNAALAAYEAGDDTKAKTLFEAASAEPASAGRAYLYLGKLAHKAGKLDAAVQAFDAVLTREPNHAEAHFLRGKTLCNQTSSASIFSKLGLAKDCLKAAEKAVSLAPNNNDYVEFLVGYHINAPAIAGGDSDKAKTLIASIAARDPALALALQAQMALKDEKAAEAEKLYRQAIATGSPTSRYRIELANYYQGVERYADAYALLNEQLKQTPDDSQTLYQLGRTAVLAKRYLDEGAEALQAYLKNPPKSGTSAPSRAWAALRLGQIYALQGKPLEAKNHYQLAAQDKTDQRLQDTLEELL